MLSTTVIPTLTPETPPIIEPYQVYKKLCALQPFKICGPDNIILRILKEFAHKFAEPVAIIFNTSLTSGTFPAVLKNLCISPIPNVLQPTCEGDTQPISLTPCLSKVLENFVVQWKMS